MRVGIVKLKAVVLCSQFFLPRAAPQKLYIILQYIDGGELYEYAVAKYALKQSLPSLLYCNWNALTIAGLGTSWVRMRLVYSGGS